MITSIDYYTTNFFCYNISFLNEGLTESIELYRDNNFTPEDNAIFVQRFMPRLVVAIGRLCEFVEENK